MAEERIEELNDMLGEMDKKSLSEIKSFAKPPKPVLLTFEATMLVLGHSPDKAKNWAFCRSQMGQLKEQLEKFDPNTCNKENVKMAEGLLQDYSSDMLRCVSHGAAVVYEWTTGMINLILHPDE